MTCELFQLPKWIPKRYGFKRDWTTCSIELGDMYDHIMSTIIFTLKNEVDIIELQKLRGKQLQPRFGFVNHLVLILCFISQEKWTCQKKYPFKAHLRYHIVGGHKNFYSWWHHLVKASVFFPMSRVVKMQIRCKNFYVLT